MNVSRSRSHLRLSLLLIAGMFLPSHLAAQEGDLAAAARKEKERRAKVTKPVKVLTEEDSKAAAASGAGAVTTMVEGTNGAPAPKPEGSLDSTEEKRLAWKARGDAARAAIATAQKQLDQMEKESVTLRSDLTQVSAQEAQDPLRLQKREARIAEMNAKIEAQKVAVAEAKKALTALEEEARKAGVPVGWIR